MNTQTIRPSNGPAWLRSLSGARQALIALASAALLVAAPATVQAQETSSGLRGTVTSDDGSPIGDASVRITDTRTGTVRTVNTAPNGSITLSGMRVGGPYTLAITAPGYTDQTITDVYVDLGGAYTFTVALTPGALDEIVVTSAMLATEPLAVGPSSSYNLADLESAPAINRDIKDLIRIDPRLYIDESFGDAIQCAGANPRFNSLTVDGIRLNDGFGLNSNGYPTTRIPFSYDSIQQVAVELAPYDVQYGGFTACNINAVTKSGENEFFGSLFYDYTSDSFQGDKLEGDNLAIGDFDEDRYGFTLGGPIVRDKLFFFASYEKLEGADTFDRGPAGSGRAREIDGVSQAQFNDILDIAQNIYGYDPGGLPLSLPVDDEKILVKFDWNITDEHRASFTYNYNDGFAISQSDGDNNELEFSNHYYERGTELDAYSIQLFSDWSPVFSTEFRAAYTEADNRQLSLAGTDFGEVQIVTFNDADGDGIDSRATVYLGADDSRHANKLKYDVTNLKFAGDYLWGDHTLTFGIEREEYDIFNLFIQEAEGEYRFSSIDDFRNGTPNRITYENAAPSNNPNDAAANFSYAINTLYLQDEYTFASVPLTVIAGLRYDFYDSSDVPATNANFAARYGFSNAQNFDGEGLLQPRLAFTWEPLDTLSVRMVGPNCPGLPVSAT